MAILDLPARTWFDALGLAPDERPDALVLEGTWWRERAQAERLADLADVRETAFPEIFLGRHGKARVAYCCAYGAARAAEPAHVFAQMGTPLLIQIGTCGGLSPELQAGQVMVPDRVHARDGVAGGYDPAPILPLAPDWSATARAALRQRGVAAVGGTHLTWTTLFAQSDALCAQWADEGLETVDMETATVAAVARRFGASAIALLTVWDHLAEGKTFLDPLPPDAMAALQAANAATWETALDLAAEEAGRREAGTDHQTTRKVSSGRTP